MAANHPPPVEAAPRHQYPGPQCTRHLPCLNAGLHCRETFGEVVSDRDVAVDAGEQRVGSKAQRGGGENLGGEGVDAILGAALPSGVCRPWHALARHWCRSLRTVGTTGTRGVRLLGRHRRGPILK